MKKTINLQFAAFLSILLFNTTLCAQKNKLSISAAINSVEAQLGDPEWDSWGYVKNNFNNYGDITNKSFSLSVIPKYFISNDILLRFELGVTKINLKYFHDSDPHSINPPYSHLIQNQSIEQNIYRFIPGIQWNFLKKKFIETYCGMTVCYLHYSDMKYRDHAEQRVLATGVLYGGYEGNTTFAGGFAVGIGAFAGFNIYLSKHFSTGAESSFSFLYYKIGGTYSGVTIPLINPPATNSYSYGSSSYKGFEFSKVLPSLKVSVWF